MPGDPNVPDEDLSARIAAVQDLERRLTEGIPKVEAEQTDEDRATWLVAHLLDWHRRENKSAWWRFYDLMTHSDDELFEEKEPIAGLEFVERIVREGKAISTDDFRYRFPAQEHERRRRATMSDDPQLRRRREQDRHRRRGR